MIPGLISARIDAAGGGGGAPIAVPSYFPVLAYKSQSAGPVTATATFTIKPDGTWETGGTGYTADSGLWFNPVTVGAGAAYEVRITPVLSSGVAATITNPAAGWVALSVARAFVASITRTTGSGTTQGTYSVRVEIRLTGGATVSDASFSLDVQARIGGTGGGGCPTLAMILGQGETAESVEGGDSILICDPDTGEERLGTVQSAVTRWAQCVRVEFADGGFIECSDSAPMATDSGAVDAPNLLDLYLKTKVAGRKCSSRVTKVERIGLKLVRHISVKEDTKYFWVGNSVDSLALHHNLKQGGGDAPP